MMRSALNILHEYWGYPGFRKNQEQVVESVLSGKDTFALLPTGGGKSICYQVPGLTLEGICIVVSPLISLMEDQVEDLESRGIKARSLSSGMTPRQIDETLESCKFGQVKFLYLSPERLQTEIVRERIKQMNVNLIAIDEAHCISQWGYDFRPSFLKIPELRDLTDAPFLALTATATPKVVEDITQRLQLQTPTLIEGSFFRPNLHFRVIHTERKWQMMAQLYKEAPATGLIYVRTRRLASETARILGEMGIPSSYYHAGLSREERGKRQREWQQSNELVMAATTAFGMGIDKPDVRWVFHLDLPENLESYIQEAGRAGRDGKPSECILFHGPDDEARISSWVLDNLPDEGFIRNLYKALGNHFQIAFGSGQGESYPLDMEAFTQKYSLGPGRVYQGLKFLEAQGVLTFQERGQGKDLGQFLVDAEDLYHFQVQNPRYEDLTRSLLRLHPGIMSEPVRLDLYGLSRQLGTSKDEVKKGLQYLQHRTILEYSPATTLPVLLFHQAREPEKYLRIDRNLIDQRVRAKKERLRSVIDYVNNDRVCKQRQLVEYFGQELERDCGTCSVCRSRDRASKKDLTHSLMNILPLGQSMDLNELLGQFEPHDHESLIEIIRDGLESGSLVRQENDAILRKS